MSISIQNYFSTLWKNGYEISDFGYQVCRFTDQNKEEFKKDCITFSKAAEAFGKLLGKELVRPDEWKKLQRLNKISANSRIKLIKCV